MSNSSRVELLTIHEIAALRSRFDTEVEYQRRSVWGARDKSFLCDSILRHAPFGIITLFIENGGDWEDERDADSTIEIVDGKQRIGAIAQVLDGEFIPRSAHVARLLEEEGSSLDTSFDPAPAFDAAYQDWEDGAAKQFNSYVAPTLILAGSRDFAVNAFIRMNRQGMGLSHQELRNAVYVKSEVRKYILDVAVQLLSIDEDAGGVLGLDGVLSAADIRRMHDVQLISELLVLRMEGITPRRDRLNDFYRKYSKPDRDERESLKVALTHVVRHILAIHEALGGESLQAIGFPRRTENDYYAVVGTLMAQGRSLEPAALREFLEGAGSIRKWASRVVTENRGGETLPEKLPNVDRSLVVRYGKTLLGGQSNSKDRRRERISVLGQI